MSLIEQAAKRLEELRRAGVEVPEAAQSPTRSTAPTSSATNRRAAKLQGRHAAPTRRHRGRRIAACAAQPRVAGRSARPDDSAQRSPRSRASRREGHRHARCTAFADRRRIPRHQAAADHERDRQGRSADQQGNLIMVTSALPGEGKSFTAVNLAMSIAMELDHTVLLVDADVARPTMPGHARRCRRRAGCSTCSSTNRVDLSQVMLKTNVEKLSVLLSGTQASRGRPNCWRARR